MFTASFLAQNEIILVLTYCCFLEFCYFYTLYNNIWIGVQINIYFNNLNSSERYLINK